MLTAKSLQHWKVPFGAFLLVAAVVACDRAATAPIHSAAKTGPRMSLAPGSGVHTPMLDELFSMVNDQAPGFAGMYRSGHGGLTILVTPKGDNAQVEKAVRSVFHELDWQNVTSITFKSARWEVNQLEDWHRRLPDAVGTSALVWSDFDEVHNVVRVGVAETADLAGVASHVGTIGAPPGAVVFEHAKPIRGFQLLTASHRPTVGGIHIALSDTLNRKNLGAMSECSLNSNVRFADSPFFLAAGHCTSSPLDETVGTYANLNATVYQPDSATNPTPIGQEYYNPGAWIPGGYFSCPSSLTCRFSDAVAFSYTSNSLSNFAYLARDSSFSMTLGVDGSKFRVDSFHVDSEVPEAWLLAADTTTCDMRLHKVGWRTGWTWGCIVSTCYTVYQSAHALICQYNVASDADGGDSGAPVFVWMAPGVNRAFLAGMIYGGIPNTFFQFSSIAGIHNDLWGSWLITH
jgi:hypothetical protein